MDLKKPIQPNSVGTAQLQDSSVTSAKIADGAIVDADINAAAAIAKSKLASLGIVYGIFGKSTGDGASNPLIFNPCQNSADSAAGADGVGTPESTRQKLTMLRAGVVKNLRIRNVAGRGVTDPLTVTVRKNGVDTALAATVAGNAAADTEATDLATNVAVVAGDRLSVKVAGTLATNLSAQWSFEVDCS